MAARYHIAPRTAPHTRPTAGTPWRSVSFSFGLAATAAILLYAREDERQMGALIEAGCALGAGKQVYLVARWADWSFRHHPRFATVEDAVIVLVAAQEGKREGKPCLVK